MAVVDGLIRRTALVRILRESKQLEAGKVTSLKRFKDDVREVEKGFECGVGVEGFTDFKAGDSHRGLRDRGDAPQPLLRLAVDPGAGLVPARRRAAMFVGVARLTLQIPDSGSLKSKRQVLRRVTDRVKARFNVSVAEVEDQDLWQRATIALAVVSADQRHVDEQIQKILHFVEEMYVAPLVSREVEILSFGDQLFGNGSRARRREHPGAALRPGGPQPGRGRGDGGVGAPGWPHGAGPPAARAAGET